MPRIYGCGWNRVFTQTWFDLITWNFNNNSAHFCWLVAKVRFCGEKWTFKTVKGSNSWKMCVIRVQYLRPFNIMVAFVADIITISNLLRNGKERESGWERVAVIKFALLTNLICWLRMSSFIKSIKILKYTTPVFEILCMFMPLVVTTKSFAALEQRGLVYFSLWVRRMCYKAYIHCQKWNHKWRWFKWKNA